MALRRNKKVCLASDHTSTVAGVDVSSDQAAAFNGNGFHIEHVPQEDVIDVLKRVDVVTKCKLRQVCRYWKHLISLNEVSKAEVAVVDFRCFYVPNPRATSKSSGKQHYSSWEFTAKHRFNCGRLDLVRPEWQASRAFVRLRSHRRHGQLGDHVLQLIYDGRHDPPRFHADEAYRFPDVISSIGMYCSRLQQLILWQCGHFYPVKLHDFPFRPFEAIVDPAFTRSLHPALTVVASRIRIGYIECLPKSNLDLTLATDFLHVFQPGDWRQRRGVGLQEIVACSREQRAWVAKYASSLPAEYHAWATRGASKYHFYWFEKDVIRMDLTAGDYSKLPDFVIRGVAHCIEREGLSTSPSPFDDLRLEWL